MLFNYKRVGKIFIDSIVEAIKGKAWKWFLGSSSGLVLILVAGHNFLDLPWLESVLYGSAVLTVAFVGRAAILFIKGCLKYLHEVYIDSTYGNAIITLKNTFAIIHFYRKTPGHQDREFMIVMRTVCNNLQTIFEDITGADCCVSIKVPVNDNKIVAQTVLMNLTRDANHKDRDTEAYQNMQHDLINNTAFTVAFGKILKPGKDRYYINNSIPKTENYQNTSTESYKGGTLPYSSELVYPIIPIKSEAQQYDCLGFICVDCVKENVFTGRYDVAILEGVADGIYDIIVEKLCETNNE